MAYFLLFITIIIFTIQTISFKLFNFYFMKNLANFYLFHAIYLAIVVLVITAISYKPESIHMSTVIIAVLFGVAFIIRMLTYMKAMKIGPLSLTSLVFSFGLILPIFFGIYLWKESIGVSQVVGLLLLGVTFYLVIGNCCINSAKRIM